MSHKLINKTLVNPEKWHRSPKVKLRSGTVNNQFLLSSAPARNIHTTVSLFLLLTTFAPSLSRFLITCQWSPLCNLVCCKHTLSHMIRARWVDWESVSSVCRTQTHCWEAMCPKLDLAESLTFQLKALSLWHCLHVCNVSNVSPRSLRSANLKQDKWVCSVQRLAWKNTF